MLEHPPTIADRSGGIDRDSVVDALTTYLRARAHAAGARGWADVITRDHPDHRDAQRRAMEAAEVAGAQLHQLALALFPLPDDALEHEQFVEDADDALAAGWMDGWDGKAPTCHDLDDEIDELDQAVETVTVVGDVL